MIVLNKIKNFFNRIQKSNNITSYVSGKIIFLNTWIKKPSQLLFVLVEKTYFRIHLSVYLHCLMIYVILISVSSCKITRKHHVIISGKELPGALPTVLIHTEIVNDTAIFSVGTVRMSLCCH